MGRGFKGGAKGGRKGGGKGDPGSLDALSHRMSWFLRHGARNAGFRIDLDGWVDVQEMLRRKDFSLFSADMVETIVKYCAKQRFQAMWRDVRLYVRATQGHTMEQVSNDMHQRIRQVSDVGQQTVLHGTFLAPWWQIRTKGLKTMGRNHIHLCVGEPGDARVRSGMRSDANVIVEVSLRQILADGIEVLKSPNGVLLTAGNQDGVLPLRYFERAVWLGKQRLTLFERGKDLTEQKMKQHQDLSQAVKMALKKAGALSGTHAEETEETWSEDALRVPLLRSPRRGDRGTACARSRSRSRTRARRSISQRSRSRWPARPCSRSGERTRPPGHSHARGRPHVVPSRPSAGPPPHHPGQPRPPEGPPPYHPGPPRPPADLPPPHLRIRRLMPARPRRYLDSERDRDRHTRSRSRPRSWRHHQPSGCDRYRDVRSRSRRRSRGHHRPYKLRCSPGPSRLQPCPPAGPPPATGASKATKQSAGMADDWKKQFTPEQLAVIVANTNPIAAPIAGGVAAKVGVTAPPRYSTDMPLTAGDADVRMAAQALQGEDDAALPRAPKLYTCEGTCQDAEGNPKLFPRSVLLIKGFPLKTNGPCVPGVTWQDQCNRLCIECNIKQYYEEATPKDLKDLRFHWKTICRKTHRAADKYNTKNKEKAVEAREAMKHKLSDQQQTRCHRWAAATRDILDAYPGAKQRELRKFVLARVKTMVASIRNCLTLLDKDGEEMIEEAHKARVDHLKKLAETGVCDLPDGKLLKDPTLEFLADLSPDGKNNELFLCRICGFVAPNHLWHQARNQNGMLHLCRCRYCNAVYSPWKRDGRYCKFNKVLVNVDPDDSKKYISTPAWWTESSEQVFVNLLKEFSLKIQLGAAEMKAVTYDNISKFISDNVLASYRQPTIFEQIAVPAPGNAQFATLSTCKGYEHCDTSPQMIEGFFFKDHMHVKEEQIFKDFEVLCNELASCFKMGEVSLPEPFRWHCR